MTYARNPDGMLPAASVPHRYPLTYASGDKMLCPKCATVAENNGAALIATIDTARTPCSNCGATSPRRRLTLGE